MRLNVSIMQRMKRIHFWIILFSICLQPLGAAVLTEAEVNRMESELGITMTAYEKSQVARIAKPDGPLPQWRVDADVRIEERRRRTCKLR